jgi:Signal transduction histidine kinase
MGGPADGEREELEELVKLRTAELKASRDEAEAANRAKSAFLANMSHEIRTPLNAVLGFAQLIDRDPALSQSSRDKLAVLIRNGERLLEIVNDVLEMSRIEAGRAELAPGAFDTRALLEDMRSMFAIRAHEKRLQFEEVESEDLPPSVVADRAKLGQALVNLIDNAIKFTARGRVVVRASVPRPGRLAFEVEDTGIGIASADLERIFQPFERTRRGEETAGGAGLGLAISREYARRMGGDITLRSVEGEGSVFRLEIDAPASVNRPPPPRPRRHVALAPGQGEVSALVVDDARSNRRLLREMLEDMGFRVSEAEEGASAVAVAKADSPRVVFMDLLMPGMNGYDATVALRRLYPASAMTIIGVSASAFDVDKRHFMEAGLSGFLAKPFREEELIGSLTEFAGLRFAERGGREGAASENLSRYARRLAAMEDEWLASWKASLSQGDIKSLRRLAADAASVDRELSEWLLKAVTSYDLGTLKALVVSARRVNGSR